MNFAPRRLEERMVDVDRGNAPITEWEPARLPDWLRPRPETDDEWRRAIRELNARAKAEGSFMRYRSVAEEQSW
jgi:hypothetical protein